MGYGTGAIMAVPAHDERDYEFARKFELPIREVVVQPRSGEDAVQRTARASSAKASRSIHRLLDGLPTAGSESEDHRAGWRRTGCGKRAINYKLRDWLFSRQRYWGEPFPIVWENGKHDALAGSELPLMPPELDDYKPTGTGEPPLAKAKEWVRYSDTATRETNTMPQWAGSCWYYLRYCDPQNDDAFRRRGSGALLDAARRNPAASISTSAAPSTRCCICSTRASGTRCCSISAIFRTPEPFQRW